MRGMFQLCSELEYIDLSNFNTENVTNMERMFYECSSLTNINLSNFNTKRVQFIDEIFFGCSSLKKENIIAKDENIFNEYLNKN